MVMVMVSVNPGHNPNLKFTPNTPKHRISIVDKSRMLKNIVLSKANAVIADDRICPIHDTTTTSHILFQCAPMQQKYKDSSIAIRPKV